MIRWCSLAGRAFHRRLLWRRLLQHPPHPPPHPVRSAASHPVQSAHHRLSRRPQPYRRLLRHRVQSMSSHPHMFPHPPLQQGERFFSLLQNSCLHMCLAENQCIYVQDIFCTATGTPNMGSSPIIRFLETGQCLDWKLLSRKTSIATRPWECCSDCW